MIVHRHTTIRPQFVQMFLAIAEIFYFFVWKSDMRQAYLQSAEPLAREIFIHTYLEEYKLDASQCLKLLKELYGLCESGDLWNAKIDKYYARIWRWILPGLTLTCAVTCATVI